MNTPRPLLQRLALLAGGCLICLPASYAGPGGGSAVGAASAGGGAVGGGHAASAGPAASGHVSSGGGGFRSSVGSSNVFRSSFGGNTGANGYQRGGFAAGGVRTMPSIAANPNILNNSGQNARIAQAYAAARVNNAWSDPVEGRGAAAVGISRYGSYTASGSRGGLTANARPGNNLYPSASGYVPTRPANGHFQRGQNGNDGSRGNHRYYYNNFPYAVYYPYLYGGYGYGDGGYADSGYYGGTADDAGLTPDSDTINPGTPNFSDTPNNYYSYNGPGQDNPNAGPSNPSQTLPDAPAVGPQGPASADRSQGTPQGPDSLVEAVQDELSRRGYLEGKPDAVYTPATKDAIRRFQTDNHLPATGRINEATLHALHLD